MIRNKHKEGKQKSNITFTEAEEVTTNTDNMHKNNKYKIICIGKDNHKKVRA